MLKWAAIFGMAGVAAAIVVVSPVSEQIAAVAMALMVVFLLTAVAFAIPAVASAGADGDGRGTGRRRERRTAGGPQSDVSHRD